MGQWQDWGTAVAETEFSESEQLNWKCSWRENRGNEMEFVL